MASKPIASNLVRPSIAMNTGTDNIGANPAAPPLATWAARMTRLPVMCAVNNPPSPRKPMTSTLPAVTLSTLGSSFPPSVLSTAGGDTQTARDSPAPDPMANHLFRIDDRVEPLRVDVARFERRGPQRQVLVIGLVCDRRCLVVADHRAERGDQHQGATKQFLDPRAVQAGPFHREFAELVTRVAQDAGGMEEVVDDDGTHCIELEIALAAGEGDRVVLTDDLDADHHHRLALGRVDLARHDRGAGLILRQDQLAKAVVRAGGGH